MSIGIQSNPIEFEFVPINLIQPSSAVLIYDYVNTADADWIIGSVSTLKSNPSKSRWNHGGFALASGAHIVTGENWEFRNHDWKPIVELQMRRCRQFFW